MGAFENYMNVTYMCPPENKNLGALGVRFLPKNGVIQCIHQKMGSFLVWTPKNRVIQCANMQFRAKICKSMLKLRQNCYIYQNACKACRNLELYVKFDTKV